MSVCHGSDWPATSDVPCCLGVAYRGPESCTCWTAVYDLEQAPPRTDEDAGVQPKMCVDCAYRPNSPERQGDPKAAGDPEELQRFVDTGQPFWCHQGTRRVVRYEHPSGMTVPGSPLDYQPPVIDGRPYKADGSPGDHCGGWAAQHRKAVTRGAR